MQLFPYQEEGVKFLASRHRALLFDAPGLGKTIQAIRAADEADADSHHVISPAAVVKQWRKEDAKHRQTDIRFTSQSYEAARDKGVPAASYSTTLDEIHYLKNPNSRRTVSILGVQKYGVDGSINRSRRVWALSGTPSPRDPFDLYPVLYAVCPGALQMLNNHIMSRWQYMKKFCVMKEFRSGDGMVVLKGKNLAELSDRMAPFMLRRTKKDVFPQWREPVVDILWLESNKASETLCKAELTSEGRQLADIFRIDGLEGVRQFAETDKGISKLRRLTGLIKVPLAVEWLMGEWDSGMKKIVIACYHREVITAMDEQLKKQGKNGIIYWGGMTSKQQEEAKSDFILGDKDYFLLQIDAGGTGLDGLQKATGRLLYVECSWIGDQNEQVLARLDRIGQEEPVLGQYIALEGSLDAGIIAVASRRTAETRTLFG